jgi:hypothetical protein
MDPVFTKGAPTQETYEALDKLADEVAARHKGLEPEE